MMKYTREFLKMIVLAAQSTNGPELGCDDCWDKVDRFAELTLTGRDAEEAMPLVASHLQRCSACTDEFNALLDALKATVSLKQVS